MNTKHAKSPCCRGLIRRYGRRRRQCLSCQRTWRIRTKKRGRKSKRTNPNPALRYLRGETPSLAAMARRQGISVAGLERRLSKSRDHFLEHTPWSNPHGRGAFILVADAFVSCIGKRWYTTHLMLVRSCASSKAVIVPPVIRQGGETQPGWRAALSTLPPETHNRIVALICDGHRGLVNYAKWEGWIIQRCHFHLLAAVQGRRSRWSRSRHQEEGQQLYELVKTIITTPEGTDLLPLLTRLEDLGWETRSPQLKKVVSGFVNCVEDYRSYLRHPQLHLPRTTGAIESLIGTLKELRHRARGFSTIQSFTAWMQAALKLKSKVTCNGSDQPN